MSKSMPYIRVIPRDLFNKAKLLKCVGRLCLLIFEEGSLTVTNITFWVKKIQLCFKTIYNSKANYPLYVEFEYCDYLVFDEEGNWSLEFIEFCKTLN